MRVCHTLEPVFDDPNLILPGWKLEIAVADTVDASAEAAEEVVPPVPTDVSVTDPEVPTTVTILSGGNAANAAISACFAHPPRFWLICTTAW